MILELELTQKEEARLAQAATAKGMNMIQYARLLLGLELPRRVQPTVEEWDADLDALSNDVDPSVPPLSDEAVSRKSIYGSRA